MLNQGIIEPLVGEWALPIVPILKEMDPLDYVYIIDTSTDQHLPHAKNR